MLVPAAYVIAFYAATTSLDADTTVKVVMAFMRAKANFDVLPICFNLTGTADLDSKGRNLMCRPGGPELCLLKLGEEVKKVFVLILEVQQFVFVENFNGKKGKQGQDKEEDEQRKKKMIKMDKHSVLADFTYTSAVDKSVFGILIDNDENYDASKIRPEDMVDDLSARKLFKSLFDPEEEFQVELLKVFVRVVNEGYIKTT